MISKLNKYQRYYILLASIASICSLVLIFAKGMNSFFINSIVTILFLCGMMFIIVFSLHNLSVLTKKTSKIQAIIVPLLAIILSVYLVLLFLLLSMPLKQEEVPERVPYVVQEEVKFLRILIETDTTRVAIIDRAMHSDLVATFKLNENTKEWEKIAEVRETPEVVEALSIDDATFVLVYGPKDGAIYFNISSDTGQTWSVKEITPENSMNTFVVSFEKVDDYLQIKTGVSPWDTQDDIPLSIYNSYDHGVTWVSEHQE